MGVSYSNDMIQIGDIWEIGRTVYYVDNNYNDIKEEALGEKSSEILNFSSSMSILVT